MLHIQPAKFSSYERRDTSVQRVGAQMNQQMINESMEHTQRMLSEREKSFKPSMVNASIMSRAKRDLLENFILDAKTKLLKESLGDIFYKALPLDDEFKEKYRNNIMQVMNEKVDSLGPINTLLNELNEKTSFLKKLSKGVKDKATKLAKKKESKINETDEMNDDIFCFEDEDDLKIENISEVEVTELSEIIKDKVISVVQSENEESEKQKAMIEDIASARAINESVNLVNTSVVEEHTLFKSFMINNYKQAVAKNSDLNESSVYVEKTDEGVKVNMDYILCESIINYTLLETMYTMCIEDYSVHSVRKLSESLAYGKI